MIILFGERKCVPIALLLVFLLFPNYEGKGQSLSQRVPITFRNNQFYVPVRINGRGPYQFLLDANGSGIIRMDNRVAKELSLNIVGFQEITEGNQHRRVFLVGVDKLSIGTITHTNLKISVGKYNQSVLPIPVDGIIGLDFFANQFVRIDGPAKQLIISADTLSAQRKTSLVYRKPFLVEGKVGSKAVVINVDAGSGFPILFPTAILSGIRYTDTTHQQVVQQANTSFVLREAIIQDEIELGSLKLTNQSIYYSEKVHQITIGAGFLNDHVISFDQRRKRIQVE